MSSIVDDGALIAHYHGRQPEEMAANVGRALETDPEVADRFWALANEIEPLVDALNVVNRAPLRPQIESMIRSASSGSTSSSSAGRGAWLWNRVPLQALAASALLGIGLAGGIGISEWRDGDDGGVLVGVDVALAAVRQESRQSALEQVPSGESILVAADDRSWLVEVTPIRTFQNANGAFCREFIEVWQAAGTSNGEMGIACREDTGGWRRIATLQPN